MTKNQYIVFGAMILILAVVCFTGIPSIGHTAFLEQQSGAEADCSYSKTPNDHYNCMISHDKAINAAADTATTLNLVGPGIGIVGGFIGIILLLVGLAKPGQSTQSNASVLYSSAQSKATAGNRNPASLAAASTNFVKPSEPNISSLDQETLSFNLILKDTGPKKIAVITVIRQLTNLGLKEAKDLVESAPRTVLSEVSKNVAFEGKLQLEQGGAIAEVQPVPNPQANSRKDAPTGIQVQTTTLEQEFQKAADMLKSGLIDDDEYKELKKKIISKA